MHKSVAFLLGMFLLLSCGSMVAQSSQRTYVISDQAGVQDLEPFIKALDKANLENYRFEDARRRLNFDNGMKVDLLSVNELKAFGIEVSASARKAAREPKRNAVFTVRNGYLLEMVRPARKKGRH